MSRTNQVYVDRVVDRCIVRNLAWAKDSKSSQAILARSVIFHQAAREYTEPISYKPRLGRRNIVDHEAGRANIKAAPIAV